MAAVGDNHPGTADIRSIGSPTDLCKARGGRYLLSEASGGRTLAILVQRVYVCGQGDKGMNDVIFGIDSSAHIWSFEPVLPPVLLYGSIPCP